MYLTEVPATFHCPKFKHFVLVGFLRDCTQVKKFSEVPEESHGIPAEEAAGHKYQGTSHRSCTHNELLSGPKSINQG